jgi:hypothetical protein
MCQFLGAKIAIKTKKAKSILVFQDISRVRVTAEGHVDPGAIYLEQELLFVGGQLARFT